MQKSFKVVLLGSAAVGKSSLVKRLKDDDFYDCEESTIGAAFYSKFYVRNELATSPSNPLDVSLEIWDTAGQERYSQLAPMYYRGADAVISVYDVSRKVTFFKALEWIKKTHSMGSLSVLVGNKIDVDEREVSTKMGKKATTPDRRLGLADLFIETSAKTGEHVKDLFKKIAVYLVQKDLNGIESTFEGRADRIVLEPVAPKNWCC
jgi:Ras-related protein Rab-5C